MTSHIDEAVLQEYATEAFEEAQSHTDDLVSFLDRTTHDLRDDADTMPEEDVDEFVAEMFDDLDDLFDVETDEGLRSYMQRRMGYDWSTAERVKRTGRASVLAGSMVGAGAYGIDQEAGQHAIEAVQQEPLLGAVGIGAVAAGVAAVDKLVQRIGAGNYVEMPYPVISHSFRDINISPDEEPASYTVPTAASEFTHAYQDILNSPSFEDPVYEEGLDLGTQLAITDRYEELIDDGAAQNAWRQAFTLGFAYGTVASEDGLDPAVYEDLGVSEEEAEDLVDMYEGHSSTKQGTAIMGAAGLYVAAEEGHDEIYGEVFKGDYSSVPDWVPFHGD